MSLFSITLAQIMKPEPRYLANATEQQRIYIEPVISALYKPSSIKEISERIGLSDSSVRRHIKAMLKTGDIEEYGTMPVETAFGIRQVAMYRIKNAR